MTETNERANAILDLLEKDLKISAKKHQAEAEATVAFERQSNESGRLIVNKQVQVHMNPEIAMATDPATGEVTKEYTQLLIERVLGDDPDYTAAVEAHQESRQALENAKREVVQITEQIGVHKSMANLLAALLRYESADAS